MPLAHLINMVDITLLYIVVIYHIRTFDKCIWRIYNAIINYCCCTKCQHSRVRGYAIVTVSRAIQSIVGSPPLHTIEYYFDQSYQSYYSINIFHKFLHFLFIIHQFTLQYNFSFYIQGFSNCIVVYFGRVSYLSQFMACRSVLVSYWIQTTSP